MSVHNDYGPVAHLYDIYVNVDLDVQFFVDCASTHSGPILELMAGTGRVSKGLVRANSAVTCVDISLEMLKVLRTKFADSTNAPRTICADVRTLPLDCRS